MKTWLRYGVDPVVETPVKGKGRKSRSLTGDPQITKIDDVWVMSYFGAFYRPKAFDTFDHYRDHRQKSVNAINMAQPRPI